MLYVCDMYDPLVDADTMLTASPRSCRFGILDCIWCRPFLNHRMLIYLNIDSLVLNILVAKNASEKNVSMIP